MTGGSVTAWSVTALLSHRPHWCPRRGCSLLRRRLGRLAWRRPFAISTALLSIALVRPRRFKVFSAPPASQPCTTFEPVLQTADLLRLGRRRRWPEPLVTLGAAGLLPLLPDRVDSHTSRVRLRRSMHKATTAPHGRELHPSVSGPRGLVAPVPYPATEPGTRNQMHSLCERWEPEAGTRPTGSGTGVGWWKWISFMSPVPPEYRRAAVAVLRALLRALDRPRRA